MAEKLKIMVIKVDLECDSCYKKIKKLLCKFPEIRDQMYDEKQNTVTVTVESCCAERIRDKLCSKGGKTIRSIDFKSPPKPKELDSKPKEAEKKAKEPETKSKEADKKPKEPEKKPKEVEKKPKEAEKKPKEAEKKPKEVEKKKEGEKQKETEKVKGDKAATNGEQKKVIPKELVNVTQKSVEPVAYGAPVPMYGYPTTIFYPSNGNGYGYGFGESNGNEAYGMRRAEAAAGYHYDNYGYGYGYGGQVGHFGDIRGRPEDYFSEENTSACTIM